MREMHDKLCRDIQQLEDRKDMIKSKLAVAKTQEKINKMTSSFDGANRSMASFERYEAMADKKLDQANAMAELNKSPDSSIENLTEKYDATASASVEDELAALKASLGQ